MKEDKRLVKENRIIDAAHKAFSISGFKNTKMEDIATDAGMTKVTLYSYFKSKENLYMALTYKALLELIEAYNDAIADNKGNPGIDGAVNVMETFMCFNEQNPLYSELLLEYFQLIRTTRSGIDKEQRLTLALQESDYFTKLQSIHNQPFKLALKEVERGQKDGSIRPDIKPMLATLQAWTMGLGYTKVMSTSGGDAIFNVAHEELKKNLLKNLRIFLKQQSQN